MIHKSFLMTYLDPHRLPLTCEQVVQTAFQHLVPCPTQPSGDTAMHPIDGAIKEPRKVRINHT